MPRKKQRLLLQVSLIVLILFFSAAIYVTISNYFITREAFLSSKKEMIDRDLFDVREKAFNESILNWLFGFLEEHPELDIFRDMTPEEDDFSENHYEEFMALVETFVLSGEFDVEGSSELERYLIEKMAVSNMAMYIFQSNSRNYESITVLDVLNQEESYVIMEYTPETDVVRGDVIKYPASKHPIISDVLAGKITDHDKTIYEIYHDGEKNKDYYIGYIPLMDNGTVAGLLRIVYDWSDFRKELLRNSISSIIIGFLVFIVLNGILIFYLYRKAILPLSKVEKAVLDYAKDKNSEAASAQMNAIKVHNEIGVLSTSFASLTVEIDRYTHDILALTEEKARIGAELEFAKKIQADILPNNFPAFPDRTEFDVYASMTPAKEVGGDFYDFFLIDDDHLGMVMADVSGKGVPAALFMMMTKIMVGNLAMMGGSPAQVLAQVNTQICQNNKEEMFVTVWFGILEISTGKVTATNAGHEYPILKKADGGFELFKDKHGFVIGGMEGTRYRDYEFTLEKGGTLFLYTDGVAEATNAENELFGTDRMLAALNTNADADPKTLLANMHAAVDVFVGDAPQFDDLTMLSIKLS